MRCPRGCGFVASGPRMDEWMNAHAVACPRRGTLCVGAEQGELRRPDYLTDPIPEDQTRLGDDALTLHELARAERKMQTGTVYRSRETMRRRIGRLFRRIR